MLGNSLRSLLKTSYAGGFEVIVIDDGSIDATAEIVSRFAETDSRILLIRQRNRSRAGAIRRGLDSAS